MENPSQKGDQLFEQELQVMYQESTNGIIIFRRFQKKDFICHSCNPMFLSIFACTEGELVGKSFKEIFTGSEFSQLQQAFFNLVEYEEAYPVFVNHGEHCYKVFSKSIRTGNDGERSILLSFNQRWRYSPSFYGNQALLDAIQDAIFIFDVGEDGKYYLNYLNQSHMQASGLNIVTDLGKTPFDLVGPIDGRKVCARYEQCIESQQSLTYEEKLTFPDDPNPRWWQTRISPVIVEGKVKQIIGASRDITAYKQALTHFENVFHEYETLFNEVAFPIWQIDVDEEAHTFRIGRFNRYFEHLYGTRSAEYKGMNVTELVFEPFVNRIVDQYDQVLEKRIPLTFESSSEQNGHEIHNLITLLPVFQEGKVIHILGSIKNINEIQNKEEMHQLVDRMLIDHVDFQKRDLENSIQIQDQFLSSFTDEFREPLSSILGLAEIVMKMTPQSDLRRHYLGQLQRQSEGLLELVDTLIREKQLASEEHFRNQLFDITQLIQQSLEQIARQYNGCTERIKLKNSLSLTTIWQDKKRVSRILDYIFSYICRSIAPDEEFVMTLVSVPEKNAFQLIGELVFSAHRPILTEESGASLTEKQFDQRQNWETDEQMPLIGQFVEKVNGKLTYEQTQDRMRIILFLPSMPEI